MNLKEITSVDKLSRYLKKRRGAFGVTQEGMARAVELTKATYASYERGAVESWTPTADQIVASRIDEDRYMRKVKEADHKRRMEGISRRGPKPDPAKDNRRIPNIDYDFYKVLDSICDDEGRIIVDANHPTLQKIRVSLGGPETVASIKGFRRKLIERRRELGLTQREAGELAGVEKHIIQNFEYGATRTKTGFYQKIIDSPLFEGVDID